MVSLAIDAWNERENRQKRAADYHGLQAL